MRLASNEPSRHLELDLLPGWWAGLLVLAILVGLVALERWRPLRKQVEPSLRREARNLTMAVIAGLSVAVVQTPLVLPLTTMVDLRRFGLLKLVPLPAAVEALLAVMLMDYTLYLWHVATHKSGFLWRFHEAHHLDLDLSTTTATRFHFGEMLLSMPYRAAQVVVLGVSPGAFAIWQTLTTIQILFHHANLKLPFVVERWLSLVIVTPRMHGIHHSVVRAETDSNWSTIFSFYDRLHGTLRLNVPQDAIVIGVPAYRRSEEVTLWSSLALPFQRALHRWTRPGQNAPERRPSERGQTLLAP
ncbi:MAG: sterol desaturase family protein [Myxococcota bacterium]|nr:sterol desaturase family protein [Myxococcota bacterium]